jgi:hypothetical protein
VTSPRLSDEEKRHYVLNFIKARANRSARIDQVFFDSALARYLGDSGFRSLREGVDLSNQFLNATVALRYFEYLVAVVSETQKLSSDKVQEAFNQLFSIISALAQCMEFDKPILDFIEWDRLRPLEDRLQTVETQLRSLKTSNGERHQEMVNNFELILNWEKDAKQTLDRAKEYFNGLIRRPQDGQDERPQGGGNNER